MAWEFLFFQIPASSVAELREVARKAGVRWIDYLNELYREFVPDG